MSGQTCQCLCWHFGFADGRHWGPFVKPSARLLSEGTLAHFPIAVQGTCHASLVCHRAEYPVAVFCVLAENEIALAASFVRCVSEHHRLPQCAFHCAL